MIKIYMEQYEDEKERLAAVDAISKCKADLVNVKEATDALLPEEMGNKIFSVFHTLDEILKWLLDKENK